LLLRLLLGLLVLVREVLLAIVGLEFNAGGLAAKNGWWWWWLC